MTRKAKPQRINLKEAQPKQLKQAWLLESDHRDIPTLAQAIKAAHPGTDVGSIAAVAHFCFDLSRKVLGVQGA